MLRLTMGQPLELISLISSHDPFLHDNQKRTQQIDIVASLFERCVTLSDALGGLQLRCGALKSSGWVGFPCTVTNFIYESPRYLIMFLSLLHKPDPTILSALSRICWIRSRRSPSPAQCLLRTSGSVLLTI